MLLKKIVVAEDDDSIAHLVGMALGDAGYLCLRAKDGEEALAMTRRELPDCLVLDVMMPKADGMEVARRLKADVISSRVPILMLTAMGKVDDKVRGFEAGADDYLSKPFDLKELAARVKALIRTSRRERDRDPTSGLPGATAVDDHVGALLKDGSPVAVLHCDLMNYDSYSDAVGFKRAGESLARLGNLILGHVRAGNFGGFTGHVGGDDFLVVCPPERAETLADQLIAAFEARRSEFYEGGQLPGPGQPTRIELCIAIVDTAQTPVRTTDELAVLIAHAHMTKRREGSSWVRLPTKS